ncbi:hypothetical protein JCM19235_6623 [Vibrio maritimus]|uniref:Sigma-fimbriae tip adhesin n=1 Tax=Vibrio maritimus TaxID=990268 RepID=A0A090RRP1_9VIBR|nr:hypothetical protein JCM19235_6623 [Vibrio maritimus]
MKKTLLTTVLVLTSSSIFAFDYNGSNESKWDIGGSIAERCVVSTYDGGDRSTTLDLADASAQTTASVSLWCNTHSAKAKATYSSANSGDMVNEYGDKIKYLIDVDQAKNLSLATAQEVDQLTGQGTQVGHQTKSVKVTPQVTGNEFAGTYRDTITVQVAVN